VPLLEDGSYVFTLSREGYLTRDIAGTFAGGAVDLLDKSMLPGEKCRRVWREY